MPPLPRRLAAEVLGTGFLLAAIVGSGIMAQRLTEEAGLQLLINAVATASALAAIILAVGPVSGAHLNPAVTIVDAVFGGVTSRDAAGYVGAQLVGAIGGTIVANLMFDLPPVTWSTTVRSGPHLWLAEVVATLGLLLVIFGMVRVGQGGFVAFAVGAYIAGAFFFTSSTSFANPAVTVARSFSDTFTGISPASILGFLVAELVAVAIAVPLIRFLFPTVGEFAGRVVVPHSDA